MMTPTLRKTRLTDEEVLQQFLTTRQDKWFAVLYERHIRKVRHLCLSITKDPLLAEDYTQDIFLRTYDKLEQFEGRSSFSSWLYSLAYHYCLGVLRKLSRLPMIPLEDNHEHVAFETDDDGFSTRLTRVMQILNTLSPEDQTLLRLKYEDSLAIQEIATRYQTTDGTIKMRLKRARGRVHSLYNRFAA